MPLHLIFFSKQRFTIQPAEATLRRLFQHMTFTYNHYSSSRITTYHASTIQSCGIPTLKINRILVDVLRISFSLLCCCVKDYMYRKITSLVTYALYKCRNYLFFTELNFGRLTLFCRTFTELNENF